MLDEYLDKYYDKFGEALPMYQIARTRTDDEVIDVIKDCLKQGKDVYELDYCTLDEDVMY